MDGFSFLCPGILVHHDDDFPMLSVDNGSGSDNGDVNNLVIVDTLDIDLSAGFMDDAHIIASDTSIGASVNESSTTNSTVIGSNIDGSGYVGFSVHFAVDGDFVGRGGGTLILVESGG